MNTITIITVSLVVIYIIVLHVRLRFIEKDIEDIEEQIFDINNPGR